MSGEFSQKTRFFAVFGVILAIFISCLMPADTAGFFNDPRVQAVIDKNKVKIDPSSDDFSDLKVEDGSITGLTPGRYYRLEEYDEDGTLLKNLFIKSDGDHNNDMGEIGRLIGTEIKNLNNLTYKVKWARPIDDDYLGYFAFGDPDAASTDDETKDGEITIKGPLPDNYLILSTEIDSDKMYQVAQIPSGNWNNKSRTSAHFSSGDTTVTAIDKDNYNVYFTKEIGIYQYKFDSNTILPSYIRNKSIMELPLTDTEFVFAEYSSNSNPDGNIDNFFVLRVIRQQPLGVTIDSITVEYTDDKSPQIDATSVSHPLTDDTITISVADTSLYSSFNWYIDNSAVAVTQDEAEPNFGIFNFVMDNDTNIDNKMLGLHAVTVEGILASNGSPHTTTVWIDITP